MSPVRALPFLPLLLARADYWDDECTACPASLYKSKHCKRGGTLLGERGCGFLNVMCEGHCSDPEDSPVAPPDELYWDGQCTPCPAKLYDHCSQGGVLVGERACGTGNMYCEGHCTKPQAVAPPPTFYWDGQCTACPAKLYKDDHCLNGGHLVGERKCGPLGIHCEGKCALPASSPAPQPELYWDGQCTLCPARLYDHCSKGGKLVGERGCGALNVMCEGRCELPPPAPEPADWIIIGAGASGCAAAAALADAGESVLVLERGKSDLDIPETQSANTWPTVVNTDAAEFIRWNDGTWGAVAKVLGGGTEINGGLFIEEEPDFFHDAFGEDFDLDAFYKSSKSISDNLASPLKGNMYGRAYGSALAGLGLGASEPEPSLRMKKNSSWVALSTFNTSAPGWPRRGAAVLLHERSSSTNLRFLTEYQVLRILFDGDRATGVSVRAPGGSESVVEAKKGVILAAGAVFTPQLLQISGIGEELLLSKLDVPVVSANPEVGKNFIDRNLLNFGVWSGTQLPLFVGYAMASSTRLNLTLENEGWGKVASAFALASLGLVPPDQRTQALRDFLSPLLTGPMAGIMDNMLQFVALQHVTHSRGNVQAQSTDATEAPAVTANKLSDPRDIENQFTAMSTLSDIIDSAQVQGYVNPKEFEGTPTAAPAYLSCMNRDEDDSKAVILPCLPKDGSSREKYVKYFKDNVISSYHYFGTASYGKVTEGDTFNVKGIKNLHIVDASIFPMATRVNPQGTIMAMGHYIGTKLARAGRRLETVDTKSVHV